MRLDLLLNKLCLVKTRSIAKKACDHGQVEVDGKPAKSSQNISGGEKIAFSLYGYQTVLQLNEVPKGNVAKKDAGQYFEILQRIRIDDDDVATD